jgi:hypothetical protein
LNVGVGWGNGVEVDCAWGEAVTCEGGRRKAERIAAKIMAMSRMRVRMKRFESGCKVISKW